MEMMHIRAVERLLVVGTRALSIMTVMLTRVGPGVLFPLFGTLVVWDENWGPYEDFVT